MAAVIVLSGCSSALEPRQVTNSPSVTTPLYEGKRITDATLVIAALPDTLHPGALIEEADGFHDAFLAAFADSIQAVSTFSEVVLSAQRPTTRDIPLKLTRSHGAREYSVPETTEPLSFEGFTPDFVLLAAESGADSDHVPDPRTGLLMPVADLELRYLIWDNRESRIVSYGMAWTQGYFPENGTEERQVKWWQSRFGEAARMVIEDSPFVR